MKHPIIATLCAILVAGAAWTARAAEPTGFAAIFAEYEQIRQALMAGTTEDIAPHAEAIAAAARSLSPDFDATAAGIAPDKADTIASLLPQISAAADSLSDARTVSTARDAFYALSKPLVVVQGAVTGQRPVVVYCPMEKRSWLQPDEPVGNPYAPSMLRCGTVVSK